MVISKRTWAVPAMLGIGLALIACATGTDQPTVAQIAFSCRLPVLDGRSGTWQGGFVTFPAALLSIDPNGAFNGGALYALSGHQGGASVVWVGCVAVVRGPGSALGSGRT